MLYLFPPEIPITRSNILESLAACNRYASVQSTVLRHHSQVKYFSCVPYVLEILLENDHDGGSLELLKGLDILGVGGAPLSQDLGDILVEEGVRLVSRYGSAECGFLMSSARDFENDRDWQYLRSEGSANTLVFEPQNEEVGEKVAELVIGKDWPCVVSGFLGLVS
jgi:acyl-coenzyme A synthetase/AMP-(fatty) acid ligase